MSEQNAYAAIDPNVVPPEQAEATQAAEVVETPVEPAAEEHEGD